jgi:hypothetical protein
MFRIPQPCGAAPWRHRLVIFALACMAAGDARAAVPQVRYFEGDAYDASGARLLYHELHWLYWQHDTARRLVLYTCPDGSAFARKQVDAGAGATTPDFELRDALNGYREGVRLREGQRQVFFQEAAQQAEHSALLTLPKNSIIDAGFDDFVQEHWDALSSTGMAPVHFLVPSQLRFVEFSIRKLHDTMQDGRTLRWFRVALDAWYGFALPHIDVAYDLQTQELREYRGISNIRDEAGRNLKVAIHFPAAMRPHQGASPAMEPAAAQPLSGRCRLQ